MASEPTTLYRFFDTFDQLLYVGITKDLPRRIAQHDADKPWWRYVERIEVKHYANRRMALDAETKAIREESPAFNIADRIDEPWGMREWGGDFLHQRRCNVRPLDKWTLMRATDPAPGQTVYRRWHVNQVVRMAEENGWYE